MKDGSAISGVVVNNVEIGTTVVVNEDRGRAKITGEGFTFVAKTYGVDGSVSPTTSNTFLTVPQGGLVDITGTGYLANTDVAIYAIPNTRSRTSELLGTVTTDANGVFDDAIAVPRTFATGSYILQANGAMPSGAIRSVNIALKVSASTFMITRAAFYQPKSFDFSAKGSKKISKMIARLPSWATKVQVTVVGVSVSLASGSENVQLAWKRARFVARALEDRGMRGEFTISTYTKYSRYREASELRANLKPKKNDVGKPLTTVNITYRAP